MPVSLDGYVHAVLNSGLLAEDRLNETLRSFPCGEGAIDPQSLASRLEDSNLLTRWQNELLLAGKYKGFFLGKYRLLNLLGCGGMGQVFHAEHTLMRRPVAIKVLPKRFLSDADAVERFHREAQAIAAVDHPNIVHAFSVDNDGDLHYLVMEYVPGKDLARRVKDKGPLDCDTAANYIRQAADGLAHAHSRGLIHRDIKPANLLVDREGFVKILDLGLARLANSEQTPPVTEDETVRGTLDYMAPEQAMDARSANAKSDLYSLGCTFFFLLSGHAPFAGGSMTELILAHQAREPMDLRDIRPDLPDDLWGIVKKLMAKKPADRYSSADELSEELADWCAGRSTIDGSSTATIAKGDTISTRFHAAIPDVPPVAESAKSKAAPAAEVLVAQEPRRLPWKALAAAGTLFVGMAAVLVYFATLAPQESVEVAAASDQVSIKRRKFGEVDDVTWGNKKPKAQTAAANPPVAAKPTEKPPKVEKKDPPEKKPEVKKEQLEEKPKTPAAPPPEPAVPGESHPEMTFGETGAATVVVEAENFFAGFEQGESKWLAVSQAGASGDKAVEAGPNKGTVFEDKFESLAPRLDFRVLLARKGRYYVWVRGLGKSGADDSCHVGVNGKTNANCKHVNRFSTAWNWTRTTIDSRTPYFDVKSPGWHTFNLWMREDGLIVDKIVLTTDDKLVPSGLGPAESPKSEEKKK